LPDGDVMDQFEQAAAEADADDLTAFLTVIRERIEALEQEDGEPPAVIVLMGGTTDLMSSRMNISDATAVYMVEAFKLGLFGKLEDA
jgi:excinuclease UvrABC nuclease subunit